MADIICNIAVMFPLFETHFEYCSRYETVFIAYVLTVQSSDAEANLPFCVYRLFNDPRSTPVYSL